MRMYLDEVYPLHADDPTEHNIYLLTDGLPTDDPCSLADEWNKKTAPFNINTYVVIVKRFKSAQKLACLDATFIRVDDFPNVNCPSCEASRKTCKDYECPPMWTHKKGDTYCVDRNCE